MDSINQIEIANASELIRFPELVTQPGSIGNIEKMIIGYLLLICQPKLIVETGAFQGQTTRFLADFIALNHLPTCRIVSCDLSHVIDNLRRTDSYFKDHPEIEFVPGYLPDSLAGFLDQCDQPIDFAVVDAEHTYEAVMRELRLIHDHLRPGGYIFCHDYREHDPDYEGTIYAVDTFAGSHHYNVLPLNVSNLRNEEVIWGVALLRKPYSPRSGLKSLSYQVKMRHPLRRHKIVTQLIQKIQRLFFHDVS